MLGSVRPDTAERICWVVLLIFLAGCLVWGGGSRVDITSLPPLYVLATVSMATFLLLRRSLPLQHASAPLFCLAALAVVMAFQLIPLPPQILGALPGREVILETVVGAEPEPRWRPISLTPDLTLASLVSLVVPVAALIGFVAVPRVQTYRLVPFLLAAIGVSAIVALLQTTGGENSPFYTYRITNRGAAVGLFANRNHQALFLALGFPLLALWATERGLEPQRLQLRRLIAGAGVVFLLPMLAVTGSRGGIILGILGLILAWLQFRAGSAQQPARKRRRPMHLVLGIAGAALGAAALGMSILLSRAEAIDRLLATSPSEELRLQYLPVVWKITLDFFPFGTGFGSFDGVFRIYEPVELLQPQYFNHAHNDFIELLMTGGLPAFLVLLLFLLWLSIRGSAILRDRSRGQHAQFHRLGLGLVALILVASIFDYPLRTPLIGAVFVIACGWVAARRESA